MPSVISDYENGRRKSPGIKVVKRIVDAMIILDEKSGGKIIADFSTLPTRNVLSDAVLDMKDFNEPVSVRDFCKAIDAPVVARQDLMDQKINGYTVVDSAKAILEFSPTDLVRLHGLANEKALIFGGAHKGRSALVAVKIMNLKPKLVILHGADNIDEIAKRVAELEDVPVGLTKIKDIEELVKILKKF
jgi:putative transcriptional regulator